MSVDGHSNWKKEHGIVSNVCGFGLCLPHHGYFLIDGWSHVKGFNGMVGGWSCFGFAFCLSCTATTEWSDEIKAWILEVRQF